MAIFANRLPQYMDALAKIAPSERCDELVNHDTAFFSHVSYRFVTPLTLTRVRAWHYLRAYNNYAERIKMACWYCGKLNKGDNVYEIVLSKKWVQVCYCCLHSLEDYNIAPKMDCQCNIHNA